MTSNDQPQRRARPGPWPPAPAPSGPPPPLSWAKRTGFKGRVSAESNASNSGQIALPPPSEPHPSADLESCRSTTATAATSALPPPPTLTAASVGAGAANGEPESRAVPASADQAARRRRDAADGGRSGSGLGPRPNGQARSDLPLRPSLPQVTADDEVFTERQAHIKYELRDTPGLSETALLASALYIFISPQLLNFSLYHFSPHHDLRIATLPLYAGFLDSNPSGHRSCDGWNWRECSSSILFFMKAI